MTNYESMSMGIVGKVRVSIIMETRTSYCTVTISLEVRARSLYTIRRALSTQPVTKSYGVAPDQLRGEEDYYW